jgi:hypothetical protein
MGERRLFSVQNCSNNGERSEVELQADSQFPIAWMRILEEKGRLSELLDM